MDDDKFADRFRIASARWLGHNYSQSGVYFVTICTLNRVRYFGEIILPTGLWEEAELLPSAQAQIVRECWLEIPARSTFVVIDALVIMPDHIHGVLIFDKLDEEASVLNYQNTFGP